MRNRVTSFLLFTCVIVGLASAQTSRPNPSLSYTTVDVPGTVATTVSSINSFGEVAGYYIDFAGGPLHSFTWSNGAFSFIDFPGADSTSAAGINDAGTVVGFITKGLSQAGFSYDGVSFTRITYPGAEGTTMEGTNNAGDLVGYFSHNSIFKAFSRVGTQFQTITPPGRFLQVIAYGINNLGEIVGTAGTGNTKGFDYKNGQFTTIAVPGAVGTSPIGINDNGVISGWYLTNSTPFYNGFTLSNGVYTTIIVPGAVKTYVYGINNGGQVVGTYEDSQGIFHGFITNAGQKP